jgi:hypothetical protein
VEAEFVMEGGQGPLHGGFLDYEADVVFGGTLGDGHNVDVFAAHGGEGAAGDARGAAHVLADDRDDGDVWVGGDVLDGLFVDFWGEGFAEGL